MYHSTDVNRNCITDAISLGPKDLARSDMKDFKRSKVEERD